VITRALLRALRNDLPMPFTFRQLGGRAPYAQAVDGRFRFCCPHCRETQAVVNPRNNLAHCFHCAKNINNIDLLLLCGYGFRDAVTLLQRWLRLYRAELVAPPLRFPPPESDRAPEPVGAVLRREFGNRGQDQ
jgi:hypothetical protein